MAAILIVVGGVLLGQGLVVWLWHLFRRDRWNTETIEGDQYWSKVG